MKFQDLPRRTALGKVLHDKAFSFDKNPKNDGYQIVSISKVSLFLWFLYSHREKK